MNKWTLSTFILSLRYSIFISDVSMFAFFLIRRKRAAARSLDSLFERDYQEYLISFDSSCLSPLILISFCFVGPVKPFCWLITFGIWLTAEGEFNNDDDVFIGFIVVYAYGAIGYWLYPGNIFWLKKGEMIGGCEWGM